MSAFTLAAILANHALVANANGGGPEARRKVSFPTFLSAGSAGMVRAARDARHGSQFYAQLDGSA